MAKAKSTAKASASASEPAKLANPNPGNKTDAQTSAGLGKVTVQTAGPPETYLVQVTRATLDPGYRRVAQVLDDWANTCDCVGGSVPAPEIVSYSNDLLKLSLDPALKILAPALAAAMGNCCNTMVPAENGATAQVIRRLTLDPGAIRLGAAVDSMRNHCCEDEV